MKKSILFICLAFFTCIYSYAGGLIVKDGNTAFVKENVNAVVEFDFTKTTWEEDDNFKTWCGDKYDERLKTIRESFFTSFNKESKGLKLTEKNNDVKYKIFIEVKDLERHQAFFGAAGQGKCSATAYIKVYDLSSNQVVCEIDVDGFGSGKDYTITDGLGKCFKGLAKEIIKLK